VQGIWVDYKSFHGELRGFRSSCRRNEAAFGGEAVAKSDNGVRQLKPVLRIYDDYVAERSLVPSAAATSGSPFPPPQKQLSPAKAGLECLFQRLAEPGAFGAIVTVSGEGSRFGAAETVFGKCGRTCAVITVSSDCSRTGAAVAIFSKARRMGFIETVGGNSIEGQDRESSSEDKFGFHDQVPCFVFGMLSGYGFKTTPINLIKKRKKQHKQIS
jgi:hypothetical protein